MAVPYSMNYYTYKELSDYKYSELFGTPYFSMFVTVTGSRDIMSAIPPFNAVDIGFTSTADIDKWECRATIKNNPHGVGIGLLVGSGKIVKSEIETKFSVPYSLLTLGDGVYRFSLYVNRNEKWYGG